MTGKQYYEKYYNQAKQIKEMADEVKRTGDQEEGKAVMAAIARMANEILVEMNLEVSELGELRGVTTKAALDSIAEDMNRRWNKMVSLFEKELGDGILINDGYNKFYREICQKIEMENPGTT